MSFVILREKQVILICPVTQANDPLQVCFLFQYRCEVKRAVSRDEHHQRILYGNTGYYSHYPGSYGYQHFGANGSPATGRGRYRGRGGRILILEASACVYISNLIFLWDWKVNPEPLHPVFVICFHCSRTGQLLNCHSIVSHQYY